MAHSPFHEPFTCHIRLRAISNRLVARISLKAPSTIRGTGTLYCGPATCAWVTALRPDSVQRRNRNRCPGPDRDNPPCLARRRPRQSVRRRSSSHKACARMVRGFNLFSRNLGTGNIELGGGLTGWSVYRQAVACAAQGVPTDLRPVFVREAHETAPGCIRDQGQGEGDEGGKRGRETGMYGRCRTMAHSRPRMRRAKLTLPAARNECRRSRTSARRRRRRNATRRWPRRCTRSASSG